MVSSIPNQKSFEFRGLSTDTKPIGNNCQNANVDYAISNGSIFLEMDTVKVFCLKIVADQGTWIEL